MSDSEKSERDLIIEAMVEIQCLFVGLLERSLGHDSDIIIEKWQIKTRIENLGRITDDLKTKLETRRETDE